jgi:hypothetical protein
MRYLLIFSFFLTGCDKLFKDDVLSIPQTNYHGNELRIDGYYYQSFENNTYFIVYVFYSTGTIFSAGAFPKSNLAQIEETLQDLLWISRNKDYKKLFELIKLDYECESRL